LKTNLMSFSTISMVTLCSIGLSDCAAQQQEPSAFGGRALTAPTTTGARSDFGDAMMQSMAKMNKDMMAAPMTGDPDHDFAAMMIPHHLGAVDMAKPYLLVGKDPTLRRLAEELIVTQQQEVDVMRLRLAALGAGSGSAKPDAQSAAMTSMADYGRDRVYTADQTSNTVSVINPGTNKLLGVIRLGDPVPGALSPLYRGQLLVHGMGSRRTIERLPSCRSAPILSRSSIARQMPLRASSTSGALPTKRSSHPTAKNCGSRSR